MPSLKDLYNRGIVEIVDDDTSLGNGFEKLRFLGVPVDVTDAGDNTAIVNITGGSGSPFFTFSNKGIGEGEVFKDVVGSEVQYRKIKAGSNVSISQTDNEITIDSTGGSGSGGVRLGTSIQTFNGTTSSVDDGVGVLLNLPSSPVFLVASVSADKPCLVRAYSSSEARTADTPRGSNIPPTDTIEGLVFEVELTDTNLEYVLSHSVPFINLEVEQTEDLFLNIFNQSGSTSAISVTVKGTGISNTSKVNVTDGSSGSLIFGKGLSSTTTTTEADSLVNLTYVSNGDINGLIYWLGTDASSSPANFINPATNGEVEINHTPIFDSTFNENKSTDRLNDKGYASQIVSNPFIEWVFTDYFIVPNHYTVKHRADSPNNPLRDWKLEGSSDGVNYFELDEQINDQSINNANDFYSSSISTLRKFDRLRITGTSQTLIVIGDIEFYGEVFGKNVTISTSTEITNELAVADSKGDLVVFNGTTYEKIPVGSPGQVLTVEPTAEGGLIWKDFS